MEDVKITNRRQAMAENGKELKLTYGIVTGTAPIGGRFAETYGLCVCCDDGESLSIETIPDISPDLASIESLARLLCDNQVTPTTLPDIVNDYIEK